VLFIKVHCHDDSEGWLIELCWSHAQLLELIGVVLPFLPDCDVPRLVKLIEYRQS